MQRTIFRKDNYQETCYATNVKEPENLLFLYLFEMLNDQRFSLARFSRLALRLATRFDPWVRSFSPGSWILPQKGNIPFSTSELYAFIFIILTAENQSTQPQQNIRNKQRKKEGRQTIWK